MDGLIFTSATTSIHPTESDQHGQREPGHGTANPSTNQLVLDGMDVADVNRDGEDDISALDMLARDHATRMNQLGDVKPVLELIQRPSSQFLNT